MKLMAWNCHGLARPAAARALRNMVRDLDPMGIFLIEKQIDDVTATSILHYVGFSFVLAIPSTDRSGGLAFCWRLEPLFAVLFTSQNIMHFLVRPGSVIGDFLCFFVYGPALWRQKEEFWSVL